MATPPPDAATTEKEKRNDPDHLQQRLHIPATRPCCGHMYLWNVNSQWPVLRRVTDNRQQVACNGCQTDCVPSRLAAAQPHASRSRFTAYRQRRENHQPPLLALCILCRKRKKNSATKSRRTGEHVFGWDVCWSMCRYRAAGLARLGRVSCGQGSSTHEQRNRSLIAKQASGSPAPLQVGQSGVWPHQTLHVSIPHPAPQQQEHASRWQQGWEDYQLRRAGRAQTPPLSLNRDCVAQRQSVYLDPEGCEVDSFRRGRSQSPSDSTTIRFATRQCKRPSSPQNGQKWLRRPFPGYRAHDDCWRPPPLSRGRRHTICLNWGSG